MKWMPIESAPKDGSRIMLLRGDRSVFGSWCEDKYSRNPRPYWDHDLVRVWGIVNARTLPPTHWMPLPEPPGSEPSQYGQAKAIMDEMTDEERLSLMQEYCVHCGTKHTPCYCTRDD